MSRYFCTLFCLGLAAFVAPGCGSDASETPGATNGQQGGGAGSAGSGGSAGSAGTTNGEGGMSGSAGMAGAAGASGSAGMAGSSGSSGSGDCGMVKGPAGSVETSEGPVVGKEVEGSMAYLGIPFAKPPVGDLRWRKPQAPECRKEVLNATDYGARCLQTGQSGMPTGSEDCLTLNIWKPTTKVPAGGFPVMVFIHGGSNIAGSANYLLPGANMSLYDGRYLAQQFGAVVVTLQYRLGPLGFLAMDALASEDPDGSTGNYAIMDQQAGLRWVQANIGNFAGDPKNVLLFGESAGAVNAMVHLAATGSEGLFQRATLQSGTGWGIPKASATGFGASQAEKSSCKGKQGSELVSCLRSLPAEDVLKDMGTGHIVGSTDIPDGYVGYGPVVDGAILKQGVYATIIAGKHHKMPVMIGSNRHEMDNLLSQAPISDYAAGVKSAFPNLSQSQLGELMMLYPENSFPTARDGLVEILTDSRFTCPAKWAADALSANQTEPVYRYLFDKGLVTPSGTGKAAHGTELLYVFGTMRGFAGFTPDAADVQLADAMGASWRGFAALGMAGFQGANTWDPYEGIGERYLEISATPSMKSKYKANECAFFLSLLTSG